MLRYPYFNAKLVEGDSDCYLVQNDQSLLARKSKNLSQLGGIANGYHVLAVTYEQASIDVPFHHALCDGKGIKPFIETLIYYYCLLGYQSTASRAGIRLASDALLEGEVVDPFFEPYDYDQNKDLLQFSRYADQEIHANIATDMWSALDVPNSFRNCENIAVFNFELSADDVAKVEALGYGGICLLRPRRPRNSKLVNRPSLIFGLNHRQFH